MACEIINGREIDCRDSVGGIKEIYIANFDNVASATNTSGQISTITMVGSTKFYTVQLEKENAEYTNTTTGSLENGTNFYSSEIIFTWKKMSAAQKNSIKLMTQARMMVIVKDANDVLWVVGSTRAADALTSENKSGKAFGDMNGATITITGMEPDFDPEFTGTIQDILA